MNYKVGILSIINLFLSIQENIKKLLSQNTTENTTTDGYQGDVSSGQSTPLKLANENIRLGEQLQSFLRLVLFVCLFDLILYIPSTIFRLNRDGSSWVAPVLS